ncbi:MAG TPA: serine hydrolase domain-containing protein [Ignavibacteria bacterium]|nr:serine hydrolase domain-containing protein [Ignavibacteria bacterium]
MSTKIVFLILFSILFISCQTNPVSNNKDTKLEKLESLVDSLSNYYRIDLNRPFADFYLSYISNADTFYVSSNPQRLYTSDYHFRIASITKTFTAAAIMLLHQQGKININDFITSNIPGTTNKYIPESEDFNVPFKDEITIKLLLEHRAGVFDVTNQDIPNTVMEPYAGKNYLDYVTNLPDNRYHTFTFDELVGVVSKNNLFNFAPTSGQYKYSNTGYNILGKIIERVSGQSYSQFLKQNFFTPLELDRTSSVWQGTDIQIPEPVINSFLYENGTYFTTTYDNMSGNVAEGNIISTSRDVTKWIKMLLTGQAGINMSNVELMKQVIPNGGFPYGLGISYMEGLGYGHNGAHQSYLTITAYDPTDGVTVLVGCNFWNYPDIFQQLEQMMNIAKRGKEILREPY